jgi:hypothetical protein
LLGAIAIADPAPAAGQSVMPALAQSLSKPSSEASRRKQIWLGPRRFDFIPIIDGSAPATPWNDIAGHVDVVGLPEIFIRPEETLARLVQDLDRRRIAMAAGILPTNSFHERRAAAGWKTSPIRARRTRSSPSF